MITNAQYPIQNYTSYHEASETSEVVKKHQLQSPTVLIKYKPMESNKEDPFIEASMNLDAKGDARREIRNLFNSLSPYIFIFQIKVMYDYFKERKEEIIFQHQSLERII